MNRNCLSIHEKIGTGTFSEIYRVTYPVPEAPHASPPSYALKLVLPEYGHLVDRELIALQRLPAHPNIIQWVDIHANLFFHDRTWNAIVLAYADQGDLFGIITKTGKLHENIARSYYKQILGALRVAHSVHVFHRDLKLENILIGANGQILICDWGLSVHCISGADDSRNPVGTLAYMQPEMFIHNSTYSLKTADEWAAMCILFICVIGHPPFGKAHSSDWHYSTLLKNSDKFWKSVWHSMDRTEPAISYDLIEMVTDSFQRKYSPDIDTINVFQYKWMHMESE